MKILLTSVFLFVITYLTQAQNLIVNWPLVGNGNAVIGNNNITAGSFIAGSGITNFGFISSGAGGSSWSLSALDLTDYFEISVSTNTGYTTTITELDFSEFRSGTGITEFIVQYSFSQNFANPVNIYNFQVPDVTTTRKHTVTGLNIKIKGGETIYFRLYGFKAEGTTGTWRIAVNSLKILGSVDAANLNDTDTKINNPVNQIQASNISSLKNTENDFFPVFKFVVNDIGTSDQKPTIVKKITIYAGDKNTANWQNSIQGIQLLNGDKKIAANNYLILDNLIEINFLKDSFLISDKSSAEITLMIFLSETVIDNSVFQFKIPAQNTGLQEYTEGSGFVQQFNENIVSQIFTVDVAGTKINIVKIPKWIAANREFEIAVTVTDNFGNLEKNQAIELKLEKYSGDGALTSKQNFNRKITSDTIVWQGLVYNKEDLVQVKISDLSEQLTSFISENIQSVIPVKNVNENFENCDLNTWIQNENNHWSITDIDAVSGNYSLAQSFNSAINSIDQICKPLDSTDLFLTDKVWRFQIQYGTLPSSQNHWAVFLASNKPAGQMLTTNQELNAYVASVNLFGTDDTLKVWKIENGKSSVILKTTVNWEKQINTNQTVGIELFRSKNGFWKSFIDFNGGFENQEETGSNQTNETFLQYNLFTGIYYRYTSTNDLKLKIDDFYFGQPLPDTIKPVVITAFAVTPNKLRVLFSEKMKTETVSNPQNYYVTDFGFASGVKFISKDSLTLELTFNSVFNNNQEYLLKVQKVTDRAGNIIKENETVFEYEPFTITGFDYLNKNEIIIHFSKDLNKSASDLLNFSINNSIGNPDTVRINESDSSLIWLYFKTPFIQGTNYVLTLNNVADLFGNILPATDLPFLYYIPQPFDLVVNELLVDVNPAPRAIPAQKYIEIYNRSIFPLDLENWCLLIGTKKIILPQVIIEPKKYAIICTPEGESILRPFGQTIPVFTESDLTTSGKLITLLNEYNDVIESVNYSQSWYKNNDKDDGGWSLERIDTENFCSEIDNWKACGNMLGGTPGFLNSVNAQNPDTVKPLLLNIHAVTSNETELIFSEKISTESLQNRYNFVLNNNYYPVKVWPDSVNNRIVRLYFVKKAEPGKNTISVSGLKDFCGNSLDKTNSDFYYTPIHIISTEPLNKNQLRIIFSELPDSVAAKDTNNYLIAGKLYKPNLITTDKLNKQIYYLVFKDVFLPDTTYTLQINNIFDLRANYGIYTEQPFVFHSLSKFDVVFNEIMLDVNPVPKALPPAQYIELYNRKPFDLWLTNCILSINSKNITIPAIHIPANNYLLICKPNDAEKLKNYGKTLSILPETDLTLSSGNIGLYAPDKNLIDDLNYSSGFYNDEEKENGGWSLERIDINNFCNEKNNWKATINNNGGTPGNKNSVKDVVTDNKSPEILKVQIINARKLFVAFSEKISLQSIRITNFLANNSVGNPYKVDFVDSSKNAVNLYFNNDFPNNQPINLIITNIADDCGNKMVSKNYEIKYNTLYIKEAWIDNPYQIELIFSEEVNERTAFDTNTFIIKDFGKPQYSVRNANNTNIVYLQFSKPLENKKNYTLLIKGIENIYNTKMPEAEIVVHYYNSKKEDLLLNEILFDSYPESTDFIEIYNKSNQIIDLKNYKIEVQTSKTETAIITQNHFLLNPEEYLVLTGDSVKITETYTAKGKFIQIPDFPALPVEKAKVKIKSDKDSLLDEFEYSTAMHLKMLAKTKGVSLERLNLNLPANNANNWHSAAQSVGFATPGYKNSQTAPENNASDEVKTEPEVFTPNNDGQNDFLNIFYSFKETGLIANIIIFDKNGQIVRKLINNESISTSGNFIWDGTGENGNLMKNGIYIIYVEVFNTTGTVKKYKKTAVLSTNLN